MVRGLFILGRPVDGIIIGCTAVLGMIVGLHSVPSTFQIVLGILCGILLLAGMDTFNDYLDIEIDSMSKPWRPLPAGIVDRQLALLAAIVETISAFILGYILFNYQAIVIGLVAVILAVVYSKWLKPIFLAKNVIVAFSLSLTFLGGALAVNSTPVIDNTFLLLQSLVFLTAFTFEIHKDLGDLAGDKDHDVTTFPIRFGMSNTVWFINLCYTLAWCIALLFIFILEIDLFYLIIVMITAILLALVMYLLIKNPVKYIELTRRITTLVMGFILLGLAHISLLTYS